MVERFTGHKGVNACSNNNDKHCRLKLTAVFPLGSLLRALPETNGRSPLGLLLSLRLRLSLYGPGQHHRHVEFLAVVGVLPEDGHYLREHSCNGEAHGRPL
jgi:hypothetical protein